MTEEQEKAEREQFSQHAELFGLGPDDYGTVFNTHGETYVLVGFDLERRRYPIVAETDSGERRCFPEAIVPVIKAARKSAAVA